jgi:hypothetical protein
VPEFDPDATVIVTRNRVGGTQRRSQPLAIKIIAAVAFAGTLVAGGCLLLYSGHRSVSNPPQEAAAPPTRTQTSTAAQVAPIRTESEIFIERSDKLIAVRFQPNPHILVLDFPNLRAQGLAFNRIAAFIEKQGLPRDRVLTMTEMADALQADNSTVETYYYGHDYKAADVQRFFLTAERQGMALERAEQDLHALLAREGFLVAGISEAVISLPREGSDPFVDASGRASILWHELSHGEYFTDPVYAAFVRRFWTSDMTEADRNAFRGFLSRQGYDAKNDDLMANETQAHLVYTTDARYFNASACGLPVARVEALRTAFISRMPPGWLHDAAAETRQKLP